MVLREILAIAKFIRPEMLVATNFGICATVNGYLEIKAPDWVLCGTGEYTGTGQTELHAEIRGRCADVDDRVYFLH